MIQFKTTAAEAVKIDRVVQRAAKMWPSARAADLRLELSMDLTACHCNGTPLDFDKLLGFDDFNFAHDVIGIHDSIDRDDGFLRHNFLPKCARPR